MSRNKLIYASARATLVVACDPGTGGTWEGAVESLRRGYGTVAVWTGTGAGPGNEALLARGGLSVGSTQELFDLPTDPVRSPRAQLSLEL